MDQAYHLFGDGAGPPDGPACPDVLVQGMETGQPVHPPVVVKSFVFGKKKGLLQKIGDFIQGLLDRGRSRHLYR